MAAQKYYAISSDSIPEDPNSYIFQDQSLMIKFATKLPNAKENVRFKCFFDFDKAINFVQSVSTVNLPLDAKVEESCAYRSPSALQINAFMKLVERNCVDEAKLLVDENPRYLVNSGDAPNVLKVSSRQNALHLAAQKGHTSMVRYIVEAVTTGELMRKMYPSEEALSNRERNDRLVDFYLNLTDGCVKPNGRINGNQETPLHMASRRGFATTVEYLADVCGLNRAALDGAGETPLQVACKRASSEDDCLNRITVALTAERYLIPLYSYAPPADPITSRIGQPAVVRFSRDLYRDDKVTALAGPMSLDDATRFRVAWLRCDPDLLSPNGNKENKPSEKILHSSLESCLVATPVMPVRPIPTQAPFKHVPLRNLFTKDEENYGEKDDTSPPPAPLASPEVSFVSPSGLPNIAQLKINDASTPIFHIINKSSSTPNSDRIRSSLKNPRNLSISSPAFKRTPLLKLVATDEAKGLERVGRRLASKLGVTFLERWSFSKELVDLRSDDQLKILNSSLDESLHDVDSNISTVDHDLVENTKVAVSTKSEPSTTEHSTRHKLSQQTVDDLIMSFSDLRITVPAEDYPFLAKNIEKS